MKHCDIYLDKKNKQLNQCYLLYSQTEIMNNVLKEFDPPATRIRELLEVIVHAQSHISFGSCPPLVHLSL